LAITFPSSILRVNGIQARLLTEYPPLPIVLQAGVTPFIPFTETPKVTWVAQGVSGAGPISYRIQITWYGNGVIVPVIEIDEAGLSSPSYGVPYFKRLKHTSEQDAGGEYQILITASQSGSPNTQLGGRFRINFRPTAPVNLTVT